MTFFSILETIFIGPLKLLFEFVFDVANSFVSHPGYAIIFLSLIMNILVLPLYRRADAMQEAARDTEARLREGASHIKKTFSGDERMMILQTYYRQNDYKPTDALRGSVSLLLEIPFFMAAYQFLSRLDILRGVSFGPIKDLGAPDGLLVIGSVAINVLPVLMTLINVISSALYLKGFPLKTKIQLYGMALFFLVFLYSSPSCLVFYWTLNNLFSLVKTIFYKLKHPKTVLRIAAAVAGVVCVVLGGFVLRSQSFYTKLALIFGGLALTLPYFVPEIGKRFPAKEEKKRVEPKPDKRLFLLASLLLTVLIGLFTPSVYISASPQEFVDVSYFHDPALYIARTFCLAAGLFLVWMRVFYWLASKRGKEVFERVMWIACVVCVVNYMFFGTHLGTISPTLQYETKVSFTASEIIINAAVLAEVAFIVYVIARKWRRVASAVLAVSVLALGGMSAYNISRINASVGELSTPGGEEEAFPHITLSRDGKNVVVIMLDRALGEYVPYIMAENPSLSERFAGFTYYRNTMSFGGYTNFGAPAMLGGYEYTPVEMNRRDGELLVDKHNEALKVMPRLFSENGFDVTMCDPVYANYQWIPDLSVFDGMDGVRSYITKGRFSDPKHKQTLINNNNRNFFFFSLMKSLPLFMQPAVYDGGQYHRADSSSSGENSYGTQTRTGMSVGTGLSSSFMEPYNVLSNLPNMTKVKDGVPGKAGCFVFLANDTTHEPTLLSEPGYLPSAKVDNVEYDAAHKDRFTLDGVTLKVEDDTQMIHYQANAASLIKLGEWFDSLRAQGVWDNTRIILVSDHGRDLYHFDSLVKEHNGVKYDVELFMPLLMVKDFDAKEYTVSDEFMTNADVPSLAVEGLIDGAVNPYTGKPLNNDEKYAHDQFVITSGQWNTSRNNGACFLPSGWARVTPGDIRDLSNWEFSNSSVVLKDNSLQGAG